MFNNGTVAFFLQLQLCVFQCSSTELAGNDVPAFSTVPDAMSHSIIYFSLYNSIALVVVISSISFKF